MKTKTQQLDTRLKALSRIETENNFQGNIENYIGMTQIPTGLAGPLEMNNKSFMIPLATTEGALVASYQRGMKATRLAGGIQSICFKELISRSPLFLFEDMKTALAFQNDIAEWEPEFQKVIKTVSKHTILKNIEFVLNGSKLTVDFQFETGDAAGQNMVTIGTNEIIKFILTKSQNPPQQWYIEGNFSGDKKASRKSWMNGRGKSVQAEVLIPQKIVQEVLKSETEKMVTYFKNATLNTIQTGNFGNVGHVANGLCAFFMACGQDVACISEAGMGLLNMENRNGDLYVSLKLPCLPVGVIGGGTHLPTQKACLESLQLSPENPSKEFAEICTAIALCGEISITSAMAEHHFTEAHKNLGRRNA